MDPKDGKARTIADAEKSYGETLDEIYSTTPEILELTKIRIGFWDKLVILNAGSLALSVSAAASFRGHTIGDGGVGYLLASWKLMILAIGCSMVAQWAATGSATYLRRQLTSLKTHRKLTSIQAMLTNAGVDTPAGLRKLTADASEDVGLGQRYARPFERIAHYVGTASQICTVWSFYYLYRFANVNLGRF